jgi:hypothetical protein
VSLPNLFDDTVKTRMRALYGARPVHDDAWYARRLAHALQCLAVADRVHTPEELAAARAALAVDPQEPQHTLFNAPPSRESCPGDKPRPAAGGCAFLSGSLGDNSVNEYLHDHIGRFITLADHETHLSGVCPFHKEETPSFTVNKKTNIYHCFGCGAHGHADDFEIEFMRVTEATEG